MKSGATLIELLLVVVIVGIISMVGAVFYSRFLTQNSVDNTTDLILQSLRKAQIFAMESRKSDTTGWGTTFVNNKVYVYQGSTFAGRDNTWDEITSIGDNITVSAFETNFSRGTGMPDAIDTITISGNNSTKSVQINAQGRIARI